MQKIIKIVAREILDSRGDPTVEVELETDGHIRTISSVPSGASIGSYEAVEVRDKDPQRFGGMGVLKAVENIKNTLGPSLVGVDVTNQKSIDETLAGLDGTPHKSKMGANALLAISMAACRAGAISKGIPLYRYIQGLSETKEAKIPLPMFNFIEGAKHADNNLIIQEFLVVPEKEIFFDNYRLASELFHNLKKILKNRGLGSAVGHEGGFAPSLPSDEDALRLLQETGQLKIALDFAGAVPNELPLEKIASSYPVISFEDPVAEDDLEAWADVTKTYGNRILIVGDDVFSSSVSRFQEGVAKNIANAAIVKPNQIGTITEVIDFVKLAKSSNYKLVVSHRSGETEDSFISDFAVGIAADYAKLGAPSRGERVSKYNRLVRIEEELKNKGK
ncbi:MAG: enolase [Candidatus Berkelbacteria bacterium]|nr:enolase [Candidatus Berkelbacteria bacterium]